jgi:hypothetical protein
MAGLASSLVNWSALWRIILAALVGGAGVVIAFGFVLLGVKNAKLAAGRSTIAMHRILAGACGVFCVGAVVIGIYAMTQKPSSHAAPKPKPAGLPAPVQAKS